MIMVNNNEVIVDQDSSMDYGKFLWEVIDLMSTRTSIMAFCGKKPKISYEKMDDIKVEKEKIIIMQCDDEKDFFKAINELSSNLIHDFYITINASKTSIKNAIEDAINFDIDYYLKQFPKTIHIEEEGFIIDLDVFSNYAFQIERIVKRFNK